MEKIKILKAGGFIDFYINKDKFLGYKTKKAKFNYVYRQLNKILQLNIGKVINDIELRDVFISINDFYGIDDFFIINDIDYSANNELELNNEFITLRIFQINILGLLKQPFDTFNLYNKIKGFNYCISICDIKIV